MFIIVKFFALHQFFGRIVAITPRLLDGERLGGHYPERSSVDIPIRMLVCWKLAITVQERKEFTVVYYNAR
jgi:hypothetical protein